MAAPGTICTIYQSSFLGGAGPVAVGPDEQKERHLALGRPATSGGRWQDAEPNQSKRVRPRRVR